MRGLIYATQSECLHCGFALEDDSSGQQDAERMDHATGWDVP